MKLKKLSEKIKLNGKEIISFKKKCFIVAEISANHGGDLNTMLKTIKKAKAVGADAVKIQSYQPETMTLNVKNKHFLINDKSIWKGKYLFDLYKEAFTPFKWHKKIFQAAKKEKILCFSAPFDISAVNLLESLGCPIYKIASPEIEDLKLIERVARTKKPIIISTGIASEKDISVAIKICKKNKNYNVILLNCISSYPASPEELNLKHINKLKKYSRIVGYSDHSNTDEACLTSVALGAKVVEKHFILNKKIKSHDKKFSYDASEFLNLVKNIRRVEKILGKEYVDKKKILKKKLKTITRSIFFSRDIKKGQTISEFHIKSVRPGTGYPLKYFDKIIGKKAKKNCFKGQPVKKGDF